MYTEPIKRAHSNSKQTPLWPIRRRGLFVEYFWSYLLTTIVVIVFTIMALKIGIVMIDWLFGHPG